MKNQKQTDKRTKAPKLPKVARRKADVQEVRRWAYKNMRFYAVEKETAALAFAYHLDEDVSYDEVTECPLDSERGVSVDYRAAPGA